MAYPALPDRRMPYDADGTVVYRGTLIAGAEAALSGAELIEINDDDFVAYGGPAYGTETPTLFFFFPETREVTAIYARATNGATGELGLSANAVEQITGSNDTVNGLDGTWEVATMPGGFPGYVNSFSWRDGIKEVSFTGPKKNIRVTTVGETGTGGVPNHHFAIYHLYGEAAGGAMAHDLIFIDQDDTPGVEFAAPEDFGDQPLGTTVVREFRIKNTSATKTATNISVQCNDTDFTIGESSSGPWVVTINIASLAPGAESATMYLRCTTPAPGAQLKPRYARVIATCDAGFFG